MTQYLDHKNISFTKYIIIHHYTEIYTMSNYCKCHWKCTDSYALWETIAVSFVEFWNCRIISNSIPHSMENEKVVLSKIYICKICKNNIPLTKTTYLLHSIFNLTCVCIIFSSKKKVKILCFLVLYIIQFSGNFVYFFGKIFCIFYKTIF